MTGEFWTDERISTALAVASASPAAAEPERCFHADLFWHLVRRELGEKLTAEMLDHAAACPDCLLALRLARAVGSDPASSTPASARKPALSAVRDFLPKALLHPAAALAYLLLLVLSFPVYRLLTDTGTAAPPTIVARTTVPVAPSPAPFVTEGLRGLRALRLTGDLSLRGAPKPEPARVALSPGEALALKLFPDLEELPGDPRAALTVRVLEDGKELTSVQRRVEDLEADESFQLLLDPGLLRAGQTYRVELRVESAAPRVILTQAFHLDAR